MKKILIILSLLLLAGCAGLSPAPEASPTPLESSDIPTGWEAQEERFCAILEEEGLTSYTLLDSSQMSREVLENRDGAVLIERCIGVAEDAEGNGRVLNAKDPGFDYVSYRGLEIPWSPGDTFVTYFIYNPFNNYISHQILYLVLFSFNILVIYYHFLSFMSSFFHTLNEFYEM